MPLVQGAKFNNYHIADSVGAGGMGEVYRATDLVLKRDVALKVLPEAFSSDAERLGRFRREAELLASLNHPNIAQIYGLESAEGVTALIMELIEGPTLADCIAQGPLPPDEAIGIALQICAALEAAHEKGIVHRDLKPANIKLRPDGTVKVLDFGIAKALEAPAGASGPHSPALTTPAMTTSGVILGTAAYMSPEQARGKTVDERADIWAFGCVLFEMLTGQPGFGGEDVTTTLARVLEREVDLRTLPATLSPAVRHTLNLCLRKDPKKRIRHISDVRLALEGEFESGLAHTARSVVNKPTLPWVLGGIAATLLAVLATWLLKPMPEQVATPVVRFEFAPNTGEVARSTSRDVLAVSADGTKIVYNTNLGLMLREIDALESRPIPGTQLVVGMSNPFFSPDSQWIAFWDLAAQQLKKIPVAGGTALVLAPAANLQGASWHPDGSRIVYGQPDGIMEVAANGGTPVLLVDSPNAWDPQYLPDGAILFTAATNAVIKEIRIQMPGSDAARVAFPGERAIYTASGHLVVTDPVTSPTTLFARAFDIDTYKLGGPIPVASNVISAFGKTHFALSANGVLVSVYGEAATSAELPALNLTRVSRDGTRQALGAPLRAYRNPRVSPDGTQVAVEIVNADNTGSSIWIYDMAGDTDLRRLTQVNEGSNNTRPLWTRDGQSIVFMSNRDKPGGIYVQPADGSGSAQRLTTAEPGLMHLPESWAPDGTLSFGKVREDFSGSTWDIYLRSPHGEVSPFRAIPDTNQFSSVFSPDGNWLAYIEGDATGAGEFFRLYVERHPQTGERHEVAIEGAGWPVWSPDGSQLFYRRGVGSAPRTLHSIALLESAQRFRFTTTDSIEIGGFLQHINYRDYDMLPDGSGWLMLTSTDGSLSTGGAIQTAQPLRVQVVLNWFQELEQRVPTAQ
jgi:eukaryotic-like serine/threonine-protein kinase